MCVLQPLYTHWDLNSYCVLLVSFMNFLTDPGGGWKKPRDVGNISKNCNETVYYFDVCTVHFDSFLSRPTNVKYKYLYIY